MKSTYKKPYNVFGLPTGLADVEPGHESLWAIEFLPKFADRLFWGFGWSTREILEEFELTFPDLVPRDIALSIIRREEGPRL
jgi:hypothetical protein